MCKVLVALERGCGATRSMCTHFDPEVIKLLLLCVAEVLYLVPSHRPTPRGRLSALFVVLGVGVVPHTRTQHVHFLLAKLSRLLPMAQMGRSLPPI